MPTLPLDPEIKGSATRLQKSRETLTKDFDPDQPRDPHTGRWIERVGHGANGSAVFRVREHDGSKVTSGKNGAFLFSERSADALKHFKRGTPVEFDVENHGAGSKTGTGRYERPVGTGAEHHEVLTSEGKTAVVPTTNLRRKVDGEVSSSFTHGFSRHDIEQVEAHIGKPVKETGMALLFDGHALRSQGGYFRLNDGKGARDPVEAIKHVLGGSKTEGAPITGARLRAEFSTAELMGARREAEEHGEAVLNIDGYDEYVSKTLIERALNG